MKAILVFDINEYSYKAIKKHFSGDITLHLGNGGVKCNFKDAILKLIPQKYDEELIREQKGWNNCIDEILGEQA